MSDYRPLIGITADIAGHPEEGGERAYMVRQNYVEAIARAGGMAVILPYDPAGAADYIARIDGLLVTGGRFDLPPHWYGGTPADGAVLKEDRSLAERALITAALAVDLPVLGVCNGMQLLGVMHGAPVVEHIPDDVPGALHHMAPDRPHEAQHEVRFAPGSALAALAGAASAQVNSVHHQALRPAPGLRVAAIAGDGVIEAIELPRYRFCFGLQWHPEYAVSPPDAAILQGFIAASAAYRELGGWAIPW
jgi:putative glutamine amidotransferase